MSISAFDTLMQRVEALEARVFATDPVPCTAPVEEEIIEIDEQGNVGPDVDTDQLAQVSEPVNDTDGTDESEPVLV